MFLADETLVVKACIDNQFAHKEQVGGFDNASEAARDFTWVVFLQFCNYLDFTVSFVVAKRAFDQALPVARIGIRRAMDAAYSLLAGVVRLLKKEQDRLTKELRGIEAALARLWQRGK